MSVTQQMEFNKEFSDNWDKTITTQIVLYSSYSNIKEPNIIYGECGTEVDYLRHLRGQEEQSDLEIKEVTIEQPLVDGTKIDKTFRPELETGILDDLNRYVMMSQQDADKIDFPEITDDIVKQQALDRDKDDYFETRVYAQGQKIVQFIDGLIQRDKYPSEIFGKYDKILVKLMDSNGQDASYQLNNLRIIARSVIPSRIRLEESETVEAVMLSDAKTE